MQKYFFPVSGSIDAPDEIGKEFGSAALAYRHASGLVCDLLTRSEDFLTSPDELRVDVVMGTGRRVATIVVVADWCDDLGA